MCISRIIRTAECDALKINDGHLTYNRNLISTHQFAAEFAAQLSVLLSHAGVCCSKQSANAYDFTLSILSAVGMHGMLSVVGIYTLKYYHQHSCVHATAALKFWDTHFIDNTNSTTIIERVA